MELNYKNYKRNKLLILSVVIFLLLSTASAFAHGEDKVELVIVNGDTIFTADVNNEIINNHTAMQSPLDIDFKNFLDKLVNDRLILQEAYGIGLNEEDYFVRWINRNRKEHAVNRYVKTIYNADLEIPESEVRAHFEKYYYKMQFRTVFKATEEEALEVYNAILEGASMDSVAKASTIGPRSVVGGLQDLKYYTELPVELRDIAAGMKQGELAKPILFRNFYVVFRIEVKEEPQEENFQTLQKGIKQNLKREQLQKRWENFVDSMIVSNPVNSNDSIISAISDDGPNVMSKEFVKESNLPALWLDDNNFVTEKELRKEISRAIMQAAQTPFDNHLEMAVKNKSLDIIFSYNAFKKGYHDDPEVNHQMSISIDSAMIEQYIKEFVVSKIKFNQDEFDEYYNANLDDFRNPDKVMITQRIVSTKDSAQMICDRVMGGADFNYLVKQIGLVNSIADEDDQWLELESFPESVSADLEKLKVGQVSGPYDVGNGFMVINLKDRRKGEVKPIKEVDMEIRGVMFQRKFKELLDANLETIRANSEIIYKDKNIDTYFNN